jgi:HEAT repeat protein
LIPVARQAEGEVLMKHILPIGVTLLVLCGGLSEAQAQDPVGSLALLLRDRDKEVRRAAAFALKYFPQADAALQSLVEAFKDNDEVVRANAVDAVVLMTPRSTVPTLTLALRDKDPLTRQYAAMALGRIRRYTDEAIPDLVQLLKDENDNVRQASIEALKSIQRSTTPY